MDTLNIIITGVGAPGTVGTIHSIKDIKNIRIIGVDVDPDAAGKHVVDKFFPIPSATEEDQFIKELLTITKKEKVSLIIPQVTAELLPLSRNKAIFKKEGCTILVNNEKNINILNNKYLLLETFKKAGLPTPQYKLIRRKEDLKQAAQELGYPKKRVVAKIPISNSMRGLRILAADIKKEKLFFEKPIGIYEDLRSFINYFTKENFPELLLTEYLPGKEITVDCLADNGEPIIIMPRMRNKIRTGITFQGTSIKEENIIKQCERIIKYLRLSHMFGFQFKYSEKGEPIILECNPRVQGTMVLSSYCNANVIKGAIDLISKKKTNLRQENISWGTRISRYWGGIIDHQGTYKGKF